MAFKCGQFAKSTDAAPVAQVISGLPFKPKLLFLWGNAVTATGIDTDHTSSFHSFSCETPTAVIECASVSIADQDNVTDRNCRGRMALTAAHFIDYNGNLLAEATLTLNPDGFTLTWTTNDANAYLISYAAYADDNLDAKIINWTKVAGSVPQSVTGATFQPDSVIHLFGISPGALPVASTYDVQGWGAMTAAIQWSLAWGQHPRSDCKSYHHSMDDRCIEGIKLGLTSGRYWLAQYTSMNPDGFTITWTESTALAWQFASLCLRGANINIGADCKGSNETVQPVTGVGFLPEGVILFFNDEAQASTIASDAKLSMGAADGTNQVNSMFFDEIVDPTDSCMLSWTDRVLEWRDDGHVLVNKAVLTSLDADGFTLTWSVQANTNYPFKYIAFQGTVNSQRTLPTLGVGK